MANGQMRPVAALLLFLNFCMYAIVLGIGGWAVNKAIDDGFIIGPDFELPAHFSPIYFPMGNAATGFFVTFAMLAGVAGIASVIAGLNHIRSWYSGSLPSAASIAGIAWTLTLLVPWDLHAKKLSSKAGMLVWYKRNSVKLFNLYRSANANKIRLLQRTMEAFIIILAVTQLFYIAAIHGGAKMTSAENMVKCSVIASSI